MPAEPGAADCPQGLSWSWQLDFGALMAAVNGTPPPGASSAGRSGTAPADRSGASACGTAPAASLWQCPGLIGPGVLRHGPGGRCPGGRARWRRRRTPG